MTIKNAFIILATSIACLPFAGAQEEKITSQSISVFIIDDQTGEELAEKHGIRPLAVSDLEDLINAVLRGKSPVRIMHQAVDEDTSDNAVATLVFRPFTGGPPPLAPPSNLPIRRLAQEMKCYHIERAAWQQGILSYRKTTRDSLEQFVKGVTLTQAEVASRFERIIAERNGRDFNRSDILGCVTAANRMLGETGRRFLIINSDAEDLPSRSVRSPRSTPVTAVELDPGVELIFVNTSRVPDRGVLFRGTNHPAHHADSLAEAMKLIIGAVPEGKPGLVKAER